MTSKRTTYFVDEAGDGILFGRKGRERLSDPDAPRFFMLGMVQCECEPDVTDALEQLRSDLLSRPLYSGIPSMQENAGKTAKHFHAKDDHAEVRAKVFERLCELDFRFFAIIKDMREVRRYVRERNRLHASYRYKPDELYDLTARMLFKQRLHKEDRYRIVFARRGKKDRTRRLMTELKSTRQRFLDENGFMSDAELEILPAYPWDSPCLQVADYCLWALQRCYERHEARFIQAIWDKVSLIHDADDPEGEKYGTFLSKKKAPPNPQQIKTRWI